MEWVRLLVCPGLARLGVFAAVAALTAFGPASALAQTSGNVLVVINENSPASVEIGEYYTAKRAVPSTNVLRLQTVITETIQRADYERTIDDPIGAWLVRHSLQDQVLYIVLTKGVPIRVAGSGGRDATVASVDSELTLLYRRLLGIANPVLGHVVNPYHLGTASVSDARPFSRAEFDIYLVTRLDGFSTDDVRKLIDRGIEPVAGGKVVLDQKATMFDAGGDRWLRETAARLDQQTTDGRVLLETTKAVAQTTEPVIGYYSWGSNDPANQLRRFGLTFSAGAIGGMFVSTDGRTFAQPPSEWTPSPPSGGRTFAGSFQSLAGDLIRDGITGIAAHVDEPFLDATVRPQILFPAYFAGFNLAESFYLSMPYLSWQTIVIGDPLCAPFPRKRPATAEVEGVIDPVSQMPALYTERRLSRMDRSMNQTALKTMLSIEAEVARGNSDGIEPLLVRSTELEPRLMEAHLRLAALYAGRAEHSRAAERYRRVLSLDANNAVALNDFAYLLAEHLKQPKEALPLAEKALRLSRLGPVLDTVGWIHHLLGDDVRAVGYLEQAVSASPRHPDVLLHAAAVRAALNDTTRARAALDAALKASPAYGDRPDVQALRARLK